MPYIEKILKIIFDYNIPVSTIPATVSINNQRINQVQPGAVGYWYNSTIATLYVLSTSYSVSANVVIVF